MTLRYLVLFLCPSCFLCFLPSRLADDGSLLSLDLPRETMHKWASPSSSLQLMILGAIAFQSPLAESAFGTVQTWQVRVPRPKKWNHHYIRSIESWRPTHFAKPTRSCSCSGGHFLVPVGPYSEQDARLRHCRPWPLFIRNLCACACISFLPFVAFIKSTQ